MPQDGIMGYRGVGCRGESRPGAGLEGVPNVNKKFKITVLLNKVGVFLSNIVVH